MNTRIENLLSNLTLEEKILLLSGMGMWHSHAIERIGIPSLKVSDGPNGVRGEARDTLEQTSASFPVGTAMGATWNPALIAEIGQALGEETRAKKAHVLLGPTVNTHRAPLAGRNFECFSEDPYLSTQMTIPYIRGLQNEGVGACVKHFSCNDQEYERFSISAEVPQRALHEIYLPAFKAAIQDAGCWTLMSAYNRINGTYASENDALLLDILKGDWGFDGLVISDWYGTYSERILHSGLDLEMPGPARWFGEKALQAVSSGEVEESWVDDKVRRLLLTLERVGAFEQDPDRTEQSNNNPEHRDLIRRAGTEAIVLLKNEGNLLPLAPNLQSIAVIGSNAMHVAFQGGGSSQVNPHYVISPVDAIRNRAGEYTNVIYSLGCPIHKQIPPIEKTWLFDENGEEGGLTAVYYDNPDFAGDPVHRSIVRESSLSWFGETNPNYDPAGFSVRMIGSLKVPKTAEYDFVFFATGNGRWELDGKTIVELSGADESGETLHGERSLTLEKDQMYPLVLEFASQPGPRWRTIGLRCLPPLPDDPISDAVSLAKTVDVVILVAGLTPEWEAEGFDRESMDLPGDQNELIRRVAEANENTIIVLNAGSAVHMPWINEVPAVLQMWYLGQESGNSLADVLFGDADPSGRLPTTFPKRIQDSPSYINFPGENSVVRYGEGIFVGYRYYDYKQIEPLFPFGHGLSYTTFEYSNLDISNPEISPGESLSFSVQITNTGQRAGKEVVQVYLRDEEARLVRPPKELKAFEKVYLDAGETATIPFELDRNAMAYYDDQLNEWVVEPGEFTIMVGRSSQDVQLEGKFVVKDHPSALE